MEYVTSQCLEQIRSNPKIRQRLAFEHPLWFSLLYLQRHFSYSFAPFHMEMFHLMHQEPQYRFIAMMAFRESGKSTVMNMANVLWSILGKHSKKFALVVSKTQEQAKNHFANIKEELENNELLREDFGPFAGDEAAWNKLSLELEYHGSKIISVSRDQSVRGLRHRQFRPDLIVCDDQEDAAEEESRAVYERFMSEIVPLGSAGTRIVVLGNLLRKDSFMMRLRSEIQEKKIDGVFRAYPLLDNNGKILWPNKFPDLEAVKNLREKLSDAAWAREYLLTLGDPPKLFYRDDREREFYEETGKLSEEYGDVLKIVYPDAGAEQVALIPQMRAFAISAPIPESHTQFPGQDDPIQKRYSEYVRKIDRLILKYYYGR